MKILLTSDGSENALAAEQFLATFPFATEPDVILTHVTPVPMADVGHVYEQYCAEGEKILQAAALRCSKWARKVERRLLSGHAAKLLVKLAAEVQCDVVVMGARGLGGVGRFLLGSTSDAVAKHAPCSVLIVRPPQEGNTSGGVKKVLVATDESAAATRAVERFSQLKFPAGSEMTVATVMIDALPAYDLVDLVLPPAAMTQRRQEYEKLLTTAQSRLQVSGAAVNTQVLEGANAADAILQQADKLQSDLIVMGSTGLSGWERLLLGSVSVRVLHHAKMSVWIERVPATH